MFLPKVPIVYFGALGEKMVKSIRLIGAVLRVGSWCRGAAEGC
jgi:hypothetical protein